MLAHPTQERLTALGLIGMAKAFDDQRRQPDITVLSFEERLALLLDREAMERENKRLVARLPEHGDLCSQSTVSRTENLPDRHALLRMGRALVDHYCQSFRQVPRRIVLDIDDTFDAVHGGQQLRLFNAHYDEYGFQPIVVFDGEGRMITALLRPA